MPTEIIPSLVCVNGSYTVTPSKVSHQSFHLASRSVTLNSANVTAQDFIGTTFSISGTITSGGGPLAGVTVALSGTANKKTTTDANGNYTFTSLGNGSYTVTPSKTNHSFSPESRSVIINGANVTGPGFYRDDLFDFRHSHCWRRSLGRGECSLKRASEQEDHDRRQRQLHLQHSGQRELHGDALQDRLQLYSCKPFGDRKRRKCYGPRLYRGDLFYYGNDRYRRRSFGRSDSCPERDSEQNDHDQRQRQLHLRHSGQRELHGDSRQDRLQLCSCKPVGDHKRRECYRPGLHRDFFFDLRHNHFGRRPIVRSIRDIERGGEQKDHDGRQRQLHLQYSG